MYVNLADDTEQSDSGMESLTTSKDDTPERRPEVSFVTPVLGTSPSASNPPYLALKEYDDEHRTWQPFRMRRSAASLRGRQGANSSKTNINCEPDETLSERLWGLTEMFPECVRSGTYTVTSKTWSGVKNLYQLSRSVMWVVASSSVILFAPVIFEVERAQVEEMQKSQQKQVLLGTNAAMTGPMPSLPPMPR